MNSSKYSNRKTIIIFILVVSICFMILFFSIAFSGIIFRKSALKSDINVSPADGFRITSYGIQMYVNKNNSIHIIENIDVYFTEKGRHGIYRTIPIWLAYTNKDGKTESKKSEIYNLEAVGEKYEIETVNSKKRIKIGDPNSTLPTGEHNYTISYIYDMGSDANDGFDEFIFHAFGDYWGTRINNASLEIHMPSAFNEENLNFFADKIRKNNITSELTYYTNNNTIYVSVPSTYDLEKSLTIDLVLPNGYFKKQGYNYGVFSYWLCISCIVIGILAIILFICKLMKVPKFVQTVEFYPPNGLDASEIGFLYKNDYGKRLSVALIIELASKGALTIEENKNKKEIRITKTDKQCELTENEKVVYNQLFYSKRSTILSEDKGFYFVFDILHRNLSNKFNDKIYDFRVSTTQILVSILLLIGVFTWSIAYFKINDLNPKFNVLYVIAAISLIVGTIIACCDLARKNRNSYGEQILAKIKGFKNFLETAEKERIETLVMQNPNYFYDILPYAYVLGVTKKWINKFEQIPIPKNDVGDFNYTDISSFDDISSSISSASYGIGSSSGGGCSSCGGGCSSCGGGGSW